MRYQTKNLQVFALSVLVLLTAGPALAGDEAAGEANTGEGKTGELEQPEQGTPAPLGALRVYVDPETGELAVPPAAKRERQLSPQLERMLSTSHDGLYSLVLPNGTVYVPLQGRFHSVLSVSVGEDGAVRYHHGPPRPEPGAGKGLGGEEVREDGDEGR